MKSDLTGISLIKDGNTLGYPWKIAFSHLSQLCEHVVFNVDDVAGYDAVNNTDGTYRDLLDLGLSNAAICISNWDMRNTTDGRELAKQANFLLRYVSTKWVIYLQADEIIHEDDYEKIYQVIENAPEHVTQIELFRTYFWGDLETRAPGYELYLGRIFRLGTHTVGGDGMHLVRGVGDVLRTNIPIYHYSRIGSEREVTRRIRRLDGLFHEENEVQKMPDFSYNELSQHQLNLYTGSHPFGIQQFYQGQIDE